VRLLGLSIQGFRSYGQPQELDVAALKPGLYHIAGDNGAGKSSLFEAIYWTAYERTSRGLRAGNIKNWNSTEPTVGLLAFEGPAGMVALCRSWNPNSLLANVQGKEREVTQAQVEELLGLSPSSFLFAVYFAQFTQAFVDLRPVEQTKLFTEILELEVWERAIERAAAHAREVEDQVAEVRSGRERLLGMAEELAQQDAQKQWAAWDRETVKKAAGLRAAANTARDKAKAAKAARDAAQAGSLAFRDGWAKVQAQALVVTAAGAVIRQLEKQRAELQRDDITKCPTCGQPVDRKHIKAEIKRLDHDIKRHQAIHDAEMDKHDALLRAVTKHRPASVQYLQTEQDLATAEEQAKAAQGFYDELTNQPNPFDAAVKEADVRGAQLVVAIEKSDAEIAASEALQGQAEYWVKAFKEIRLTIIRETLAQLQIEANESLFQLGLQDWSIEFDVERENKSGGVTKNFTVLVKAPGSPAGVPWEVWSGGESQRLRLAVSMGFSNLICSRAGVQPNVEFWDEPSHWLNRAGIDNLLDVLADRAERLGKVIFLADHRVLDFGRFAGTFQIAKDERGSFIAPTV
jgi:DNA repair exonuclease SbcCD ATPase subunit